MHEYTDNVTLYIGIKLDVVVHVPFTQSCAEVTTGMGLHAMSGSDDMTRRDQSTSANVDAFGRILLQNSYLPWILSCEGNLISY